MLTQAQFDQAFDLFAAHVHKYNDEYTSQGRLPKDYVWRPYRFCTHDIVLALLVVAHSRNDNLLEVDVCLTTDPPQLEDFSGEKVALTFLLSEAYKCGGSMEIAFTNNVEGGRVPAYLCDLAIYHGIDLKYALKGHITPYESRQLYLALTGFSQPATTRVMDLSVKGRLNPERACFTVVGGIWSLPEAESIILGSLYPERILLGESLPEQRHLYLQDLLIVRSAILGGSMDQKLKVVEAEPDPGQEDIVIQQEDAENELNIKFDPELWAKVYQSQSPLTLPWCHPSLTVEPQQTLIVLIRAGNVQDLRRNLRGDIVKASSLPSPACILVPRDFENIPTPERQAFLDTALEFGVSILVSPDTVTALDNDAHERLERSRITRK